MRFLSLFSGIEAASVAFGPLGWECAAVAEIEPFPCSVLAHHYPTAPNLGDVTKVTREQVRALGPLDIVVGGFPCQDLSVAGKRQGMKHADGTSTRSGLFFDAMRIADWTDARWLLVENVPGMFSSNGGADFAAVVGEMAGCEFDVPRDGWRNAGVVVGPRGLVEWTVLDAQYHGLAQRRRRVFLVRDSGDWRSRPPLFLEPYRLQGHPAPSRKTGQRPAGTIGSRASSGGGFSTDFKCDGGLIPDVSPTLISGPNSKASHGKKSGTDREVLIPVPELLCVATGQAGADMGTDMSPTLSCNHEAPYVVGSITARGGRNQGQANDDVDGNRLIATHSLRSMGHDGSHANGGGQVAVAFGGQMSVPQVDDNLSQTLQRKNPEAVMTAMQVRRLTPKECARLQGFPDDYLDITFRGKPAADGPKYKALGNSWAVPCARWIGERIQAVEAIHAARREAA